MNSNLSSREKILLAAGKIAQSRGYSGLSVRDLADQVGIRPASIYHHFPSKEDLAAAVAKRYWEDASAALDEILAESSGPMECLRQYPRTFRKSLENENRLCLCSFMAAEHDDLPEAVRSEIQTFADVNIAWLQKALVAASVVSAAASEKRARAIFAGIAGAQLIARSRDDIKVYDTIVDAYRESGLLPV